MNHLIDALIGIVSCLVAAEIWSHKDNVARWLNPEGRWLGPVDRWLISKAVERLPADARGRFCEEWLAHLDETPGTLRKLLHAVGCYLAAAQLAGLLAGQTGPEAQFTFMPAAGWFEQKRLQK